MKSPFLNPAPPAALAQKRRARLPSSDRCAGASAVLARNCTRTSTLDRSDVLFFQIIFSMIDCHFRVLVLYNSTFHIPNFNKSRHLFILTEKRSRTKLTQPLSAWRGGGRSASAVNSAAWSRRNLFALYLLRWEHFLRAPDGTHSSTISHHSPPPRQALAGWLSLIRDDFSAQINRCLLLINLE